MLLARLDIVVNYAAHSFRSRLSSASRVTAAAMRRATVLAVALNWVGSVTVGLSRPPENDACWLLEGLDELDTQLIGGGDLASRQDG